MDMKMFPSQWALILGVQQRDIWDWIMDGLLKAEVAGKKAHVISVNEVTKFLAEHPIYVGRVYCEDAIPFYNDIRRKIVDRMEDIRDGNSAYSRIGSAWG